MKRLVSVFVLSLLFAPGVALAQGPTEEPIGTLAQLMRGIMFPNANKLFDVQSQEPGAPLPETNREIDEAVSALVGPASARFASVYRGWPTVEGAAVALADGAKLAMLPGRMCSNDVPVPIDQADYIEGARLLEETSLKVLEGARNQDYEAVWDAINYITDSCTHCHRGYRDGPDSRSEPRCQ